MTLNHRKIRAKRQSAAFRGLRGLTQFTTARLDEIMNVKKRRMITDSVVPGLRAVGRPTCLVSFHVDYFIGESRCLWKIGDYPETSIEIARILAGTVRALAAKGIDPPEEMRKRMFRELIEQGANWTPSGSAPQEKIAARVTLTKIADEVQAALLCEASPLLPHEIRINRMRTAVYLDQARAQKAFAEVMKDRD